MSYEITIIQGNLGGDPELKYLPDGKAVCNFSVAVTRRRGDSKQTVWYRVAAWGETGESAAKYLKRGSGVLVSGRVDARGYVARDGQPGASLDLTAFTVQFTDKRSDSGGSSGSYDDFPEPPDNVGDIPF